MLTLPFRRTAANIDPAPEPVADVPAVAAPVMQFRTRGGAPVDLYRLTWTVRYPDPVMNTRLEEHEVTGFNWTCRGCDEHGRFSRGYEEREPRESRREANAHAAACWSMPKPTPA